MNIDEIKEIFEMVSKLITIQKVSESEPSTTEKCQIHGAFNRRVIVRSKDAGVLYGRYQGNDGDTVFLKDAVQMWKWKSLKGVSLIDVAKFGVDVKDCKFSSDSADVIVFSACAVIDVSDIASRSIEAVK